MHTLILPGWQNSGPGHWQSIWQAQHGYQRVEQHDWMHPLRGDWITRLEEYLLSINEQSNEQIYRIDAKNPNKKIILVAHSLGCHLVAAWAALSKQTHLIQGALLVAPPDAQRDDFPHEMKSWRYPVLQKLPFPSVCVISSNDPFCEHEQGRAMANAWGSELIEIGERGHINADSALQDWPQGQALLARLAYKSDRLDSSVLATY
jgi:uncharacterized protein